MKEGFDIPINFWIEVVNLIFDSPEKNLIFEFIKIINIRVIFIFEIILLIDKDIKI
jgi:hypothetical protein